MQDYILAKNLFIGFYNWCTECGLTPYLVFDASKQKGVIPEPYAKEELIINISTSAAKILQFSDEGVWTDVRISGVPCELVVPWMDVMAIGTKETNHMLPNGTYKVPMDTPVLKPSTVEPSPKTKPNRAHLTVVK